MKTLKRFITITWLLFGSALLAANEQDVIASVEYFYAQDGTLIGRAINGVRQNFEYDKRGQLLAVKDAADRDLERYTYDPAGNRLSKTVNGVTTTYTYDEANQLKTSTVNGETTHYRYDAAGRLIQAGDKAYYYFGTNDKVTEVRQGDKVIAEFEYFMDGQIASAKYPDREESFTWDGLALVQRNEVSYLNEPYVTGGNPILNSRDGVMFNDMLGSTLNIGKQPVSMTSFGETEDSAAFFTGKPMISELGYSFLFRDYNPSQGKWNSSDPLGYPDGWNNHAYVSNRSTKSIDFLGGLSFTLCNGILEDHPQKALPEYVNSSIALPGDYLSLGIAYASMETVLYNCPLAYSYASNYLSATGETQTATPGDIYDIFCSEFFDIKSIATNYIKTLNLQAGNSVSFSSGWDNGYQANQTLNLLLSLNLIYYGIGGVASKNSKGEISVSITIKIWDYYDFNPLGSALGGYDIYDATWYRFATIGFAKPFNINGQYRMDTFIIHE